MNLKRKLEKRDILSIIVLLSIFALCIWLGISYTRVFGEIDVSDLPSAAISMQNHILSYGGSAIAVIIIIQFIQVVVSFIPSVMVQFTSGVIFGIVSGMLTGYAGAFLGTVVSFYISRIFGRRVVTLFVSEKSLNKLEGLLSSDTSSLVLLVLFLLPTPKDIFAYFVGLTQMKARKFFLIAMIGRFPGMYVATYLGAHVIENNYVTVVAVSVVSSFVFLIMFLYRKRIMAFVNGRNNGNK